MSTPEGLQDHGGRGQEEGPSQAWPRARLVLHSGASWGRARLLAPQGRAHQVGRIPDYHVYRLPHQYTVSKIIAALVTLVTPEVCLVRPRYPCRNITSHKKARVGKNITRKKDHESYKGEREREREGEGEQAGEEGGGSV